jgi:hypothetical protein
MTAPRLVRWVKGVAIALAIVVVSALAWVIQVSLYSGGPSALVRQVGFLVFLAGLLVALAIVAILWWQDWRITWKVKEKYGSRERQDT